VFTARYALSPYLKQIHFVFKGLNMSAAQGGKRGCFPSVGLTQKVIFAILFHVKTNA
jgi:hypothetical protein